MTGHGPEPHPWLRKLLVLGYILLGGGILAAWMDPASGYEISIYRATTLAFWFGAGIALVITIVTVIYGGRNRLTSLGVLLGAEAMTAIVALPVIRGYRFYGLADSLTHLGWTAAIVSGEMSAFDLIYPGGHLAAILLSATGGISIDRALMLVVIACFVAFLVFVPLTLRVLIPDRLAVAIAGISAFFLLPLNNIGTHRMFHPYTLGTLLFPFLLYLLFKHGNGDVEDGSLPSILSAASVVLPVVLAAILFVHPQPALNILIFMGTIVAVQLIYRRFRPNHPISRYRAIYGQTLFLAVIFFAWNFHFWQTYRMAEGLMLAIVNTITGVSEPGAIVQNREAGLEAIGVTFTEMFTKLFLVSAIYVVLSVGLVGAKLFRALRRDHPDNHVAIAYFAFSGFTLGPFILAHYLGDISHYFFRHLGFAMVLVTLLGASALYAIQRPVDEAARSFFRPFVVLLLVTLLVLSLVTVFPSPYLYKQNHHASDQLMDGYAESLAYAQAEGTDEAAITFLGIRDGPGRFANAHGVDEWESAGSVDESAIRSGLRDHLAAQPGSEEQEYYLPVTASDRGREIIAYRSLRYSRAGFRTIETQPDVHRVKSNGDFSLYYIRT